MGFPDYTPTLPDIPVVGIRPPRAGIDEDGASRPEGEDTGPCNFLGGGKLTAAACQLATSTLGLGSVQGASEAARRANYRPRPVTDRRCEAPDQYMYDLARSDPAASADHIASGRYNSCSTSFSATFGLGIYAGSVFVFERANGMVHQFGVGGLSTGIRASASITEGAGEVVIGEFSDLEGFDLSGSGSLIVGGGGTVDWPLGEAPDVNRGYGFDVGAGLNMGAQNYLRSIPIEVVRESLPEVYQAFSYERSVDCVSTDVGDDPNFYP